MSDDPDDLDRLRDAVARSAATLLALEDDPTVQLLDASALAGVTQARWAEMAAARAALFRANHELSDVVERAAAGRPADAVALLRRASVVRVDVTRPLAERSLLDGSRRVERVTPDDLLTGMAAAFAEVREVVSAVERAWAEATAWVRAGRARLAALAVEAVALDEPLPPALEGVAGQLDACAEAALADPLAWPVAVVGAIDARLAEAGDALAVHRSVRDDWSGQLAAAHGLLASLRAAVTRSEEVADRARCRITGVDHEAVDDPSAALATALHALADRVGTAPWSEVAAALVAWRRTTEQAMAAWDARTAGHQALLDGRDELRGRLDAYMAKAARFDRLEDPDLAARYERAHRALHTAPTDLGLAGDLVRHYQDALREAGRR